MDPYATRGQARVQQRDIDSLLRTSGFQTATHLAALERQRTRQADVAWKGVLEQVGVQTPTAASLVARLRQAVGAALVRAGERLAGISRGGGSPDSAPAAGTLGPVG